MRLIRVITPLKQAYVINAHQIVEVAQTSGDTVALYFAGPCLAHGQQVLTSAEEIDDLVHNELPGVQSTKATL